MGSINGSVANKGTAPTASTGQAENEFGDEGTFSLCEALKTNTALTTLFLIRVQHKYNDEQQDFQNNNQQQRMGWALKEHAH